MECHFTVAASRKNWILGTGPKETIMTETASTNAQTSLQTNDSVIQIQDLNKWYGNFHVLKDIFPGSSNLAFRVIKDFCLLLILPLLAEYLPE